MVIIELYSLIIDRVPADNRGYKQWVHRQIQLFSKFEGIGDARGSYMSGGAHWLPTTPLFIKWMRIIWWMDLSKAAVASRI